MFCLDLRAPLIQLETYALSGVIPVLSDLGYRLIIIIMEIFVLPLSVIAK